METFITDTCEDKFNSVEDDPDIPFTGTLSFESGNDAQKKDETEKYAELCTKQDSSNAEVNIVETVSVEVQNPFYDVIDNQLNDNRLIESTANCIVSEATPAEEQEPSLESLASSDFIHNRQLAAKSILKHLQQAGSDEEAVLSVISVMCKLSVDEEFMVRSELVENFPSIALFCKTRSEDLGTVITQLVVPCTIKLLSDDQIQVRKMGYTAFLVLLDHHIIDHSQLSEWICPLISEFVTSTDSSEEARIEDVSIMCKMIQFVGKELTVKFFLEPFITLCCDSVHSIRKVCAGSFGVLSKTVGREITETTVLPAFINLCDDGESNVLKVCTEVFADVASVVSDKTRREILSHIFINLLNNESRYVQLAAYQALGGFIATFMYCSRSDVHDCTFGLQNENDKCDHKNEEESKSISDLVVKQTDSNVDCSKDVFDKSEKKETNINVGHTNVSNLIPSSEDRCKEFNSNEFFCKNKDCIADDQLQDENSNLNAKTFVQNICESISRNSPLAVTTAKRHLHIHNENVYNNFQYWRTPLPEIELDIERDTDDNLPERPKPHPVLSNSNPSKEQIKVPEMSSNVFSKVISKEYDVKVEDVLVKNCNTKTNCNVKRRYKLKSFLDIRNETVDVSDQLCYFTKDYETINASNQGYYFKWEELSNRQDIVPPVLLERFLSVTTSDSSTEEENIHCAYNFPAVAYTLGKKHWPIIRKVHDQLSRNIKYTVRKTIASSLHKLADILDHDDVVRDLLPVFLNLLKDVDAVRIKLLTNLHLFLQKLNPEERRWFLPLIKGLLIVDSDRNWRFRYTVAKELLPCVQLFSSSDIQDHFMFVPLQFLEDRVSDVRLVAVDLMAEIMKSMAGASEMSQLLYFLDRNYRQAGTWLKRQTYVFLCEKIAVKYSLPTDVFIEKIVPNMLLLAWDCVPNVRLALARCLYLTLLPLGYVSSIQETCHCELLLQVMSSLRGDSDRDVMHFAQLSNSTSNLSQQKLSPV